MIWKQGMTFNYLKICFFFHTWRCRAEGQLENVSPMATKSRMCWWILCVVAVAGYIKEELCWGFRVHHHFILLNFLFPVVVLIQTVRPKSSCTSCTSSFLIFLYILFLRYFSSYKNLFQSIYHKRNFSVDIKVRPPQMMRYSKVTHNMQ